MYKSYGTVTFQTSNKIDFMALRQQILYLFYLSSSVHPLGHYVAILSAHHVLALDHVCLPNEDAEDIVDLIEQWLICFVTLTCLLPEVCWNALPPLIKLSCHN